MFAAGQFAHFQFAGAPKINFERTIVADKPYFLQLRDSSGTLLHRLDGWFGDDYTRNINEPSRLVLTFAMSNPAVQAGDVEGPNEIWLYNGAHEIEDKLIIQKEKAIINGVRATWQVEAEGFLSQLRDEKGLISGSASPLTLDTIIGNLISGQSNSNPLSKGFIDPELAAAQRNFTGSTGKTFLSILNQLREDNIGGYFYVDEQRRLHWRKLSTAGAAFFFHPENNLGGYTEERETKNVFNRIFVEGRIQSDGTRIGIGDANKDGTENGNNYIEDTTSQTTYSVRPHWIVNHGITTEAQALTYAQWFLDEHKVAPVRRSMPAVDRLILKRGVTLTDEELDKKLRLGLAVKIRRPSIIPAAGSDSDVFTQNIVGIQRKLSAPSDVKVDFGLEQIDFFKLLAKEEKAKADEQDNTDDEIEDLVSTIIPENWTDLGDTGASIGSAGSIHQVNTAGDTIQSLSIGTAGQVPVVNTSANALTYSSGGSAGEFLKRNSGDNGVEWGSIGSPEEVTSKSDITTGASDPAAFFFVTNDTVSSDNNGLWLRDDDQNLIPVPAWAAAAS